MTFTFNIINKVKLHFSKDLTMHALLCNTSGWWEFWWLEDMVMEPGSDLLSSTTLKMVIILTDVCSRPFNLWLREKGIREIGSQGWILRINVMQWTIAFCVFTCLSLVEIIFLGVLTSFLSQMVKKEEKVKRKKKRTNSVQLKLIAWRKIPTIKALICFAQIQLFSHLH